MKNKILSIVLAGMIVSIVSGCSKKLEEHPFTVFSPEYFKTTAGFQSGIVTLYSGFRYLFGPEGACGLGTDGTDEWTFAEQPRNGAGGTQDFLTLGRYTLDASNGSILTPWNRSFNNINLANALVEFAPGVTLSTTERNVALGEIRFLRALYYMNLVQYFGAVPLDLGSGELKFNQTAFQGFNRLPMPELLVKNYQAIIDDALFATQNLPDKRPANAFKLSKAAAFHLLAKAYIHRGYSAASQASDFQSAYTAATQVINNQALYGVALQQSYGNLFTPGNDYNSEVLYSVERIPGNFAADEVTTPTGIGGGKAVDAANDFNGDYTAVRAPINTSTTQPCGTRTVLYGRPIRRFCPTPWTVNTAFGDRVYDSRFEGTFRMSYIASQTGGGYTVNVDTAFILAMTNNIADSLNGLPPYPANGPYAGGRHKPYRVIAPRDFYFSGGSIDATVTRNFYPCLSKYEDPNKLDPNNAGSRPFQVFRLGGTYLLAAEAAMKIGNTAEAMNLINVLKLRAAFKTGLSPAQVTARYDAIKLTSAGQVTIDLILDEMTREMCGESTRWPDLAVRGKLIARVTLYNTDAAPGIKPFHVLRPIPQSQLDATVDPTGTAKYQNPGY